MIGILPLEETGARLAKIDQQLVALLAKRMQLSLEVERFKRAGHQPIYRPEAETSRLNQVEAWAKVRGLNPHFARSVLYSIIGESCKEQMIQLQNTSQEHIPENEAEWYGQLKKNLITLTSEWAPQYDAEYGKTYFATQAYLKYEEEILERELSQLGNYLLALDLGCATGIQTIRLAKKFIRAVGYDISPTMVDLANSKPSIGTEFHVSDIENGILIKDKSASLVLMNMGTASDVKNLDAVLRDIRRVLEPKGLALLSFYNRNALIYQVDFLPWNIGLVAEIDLKKNCLEVHSPNGKSLPIYAHPYTQEELENLFPRGLTIKRMLTYPTLSSILPGEILEGDKNEITRNLIRELDVRLAEDGNDTGAYIIVIAEKTA